MNKVGSHLPDLRSVGIFLFDPSRDWDVVKVPLMDGGTFLVFVSQPTGDILRLPCGVETRLGVRAGMLPGNVING